MKSEAFEPERSMDRGDQEAIVHSVVLAMEPPELAKRSDAVVVGRVVRRMPSEIVWMKSLAIPLVYTDHVVQREWTNRSDFLYDYDEILVRTLGGAAPELSMHAPDEAQLEPDERVVLFLTREMGELFDELPENVFAVQGLHQGKLTIYTTADGEDFVLFSRHQERVRLGTFLRIAGIRPPETA